MLKEMKTQNEKKRCDPGSEQKLRRGEPKGRGGEILEEDEKAKTITKKLYVQHRSSHLAGTKRDPCLLLGGSSPIVAQNPMMKTANTVA